MPTMTASMQFCYAAFVAAPSVHKLESELHRARSAHLVQRAQDAKRLRKRSRGLSKRERTKTWINPSKNRMIEDVEGFHPELEL